MSKKALKPGELGAKLLLALEGYDAWQRRLGAISQQDGLALFLQHVVRTVPFYQDLFRNEVSTESLRLSDFPLVSRRTVASQRARFISDKFLLEPESRLFAKTSGATGLPLTVLFDAASWYDLNYETYATAARYIPGLLTATKPGNLGTVLLSNEINRREISLFLLPLKCALFQRRILGKGEEEDIGLVHDLREQKVPLIYGKPAYLLQLADLDEATPPSTAKIRPTAILVSGENLFSDGRKRLESWFGCRVFNAYMSVEGGLIALECAHGRGLHVQSPHVELEIINPCGDLTDEGSGEVALTNLSNWAMPFVRYRTGDQATIRFDTCHCGHVGRTIVDLPAREATVFETLRGPVDASSFDGVFALPEVRQFQLLQKNSSDFIVRWIPISDGIDVAQVEKRLFSHIRQILGETSLEIHSVKTLAKPGGKVRRYVSSNECESPEVVKRWDAALAEDQYVIDDCAGWVRAVAFSPDSTTWAAAIERRRLPGEVRLFDARSGKATILLRGHAGPVSCIAFAPDSTTCASGGADSTVRIWREIDGKQLFCLQGHTALVSAVTFSPNGKFLVSAGRDGLVILWDLVAGEIRRTFEKRRGIVSCVVFSPDGMTLAAAGGRPRGKGSIKLWDVMSGEKRGELKENSFVSSVAFTPDEETLASGNWGKTVSLWDVASEKKLATFKGHTALIQSVAFSPEAKVVASGSADCTVRLWHVWTGGELATMRAHAAPVLSVVFSPDGTTVASSSRDGTVKFWRTTEHEAHL